MFIFTSPLPSPFSPGLLSPCRSDFLRLLHLFYVVLVKLYLLLLQHLTPPFQIMDLNFHVIPHHLFFFENKNKNSPTRGRENGMRFTMGGNGDADTW